MNSERNASAAVLVDWQVKVSRDIEVTELRPLGLDMSRTRLKPVFLDTGELFIVIPAVSEEETKEKAKNIARHIVSEGAWGMDMWDIPSFLTMIEKWL